MTRFFLTKSWKGIKPATERLGLVPTLYMIITKGGTISKVVEVEVLPKSIILPEMMVAEIVLHAEKLSHGGT